MQKKMRVQKILAELGLASRRQAEAWIEEGRVRINGNVAKLGDSAALEDNLTLDGRRVRRLSGQQRTQVLIYHKPEGEICSRNDPEHKKSVFDNLPRLQQGRWINIGRLDINSCGLLLFTNNGELAHRLTHPKYEIEREYACRILGGVEPSVLQTLQRGVMLDDGIASFEQIRAAGGEGANRWYHVMLREGRNREVRRLWASQGCTVSRLLRVRYGSVHLPKDLPRGKCRELSPKQVSDLAALVKLDVDHKVEGRDGRKGRGARPGNKRYAGKTAEPGRGAGFRADVGTDTGTGRARSPLRRRRDTIRQSDAVKETVCAQRKPKIHLKPSGKKTNPKK